MKDICESCNGHGYVKFRNGGDEGCSECDGEGMSYIEDERGNTRCRNCYDKIEGGYCGCYSGGKANK